MSKYEFDECQNVITFNKAYFDYIMKQKNWGDLHALYSYLYYYLVTENFSASTLDNSSISKSLNWSSIKICKVKEQLKECNLLDSNENLKIVRYGR